VARYREEEEGAIHHVFARGVNRRDLFRDAEDYERYLRMLAEAVGRFDWVLLGFCLLPNHVHLLIETPKPNLGAGMQWLHSLYAATFNERWGLRGEGHVFQGPYGSRRVRDDLYFLRVTAYVLANAPAAGRGRASPSSAGSRGRDGLRTMYCSSATGSSPAETIRLRGSFGNKRCSDPLLLRSSFSEGVEGGPVARVGDVVGGQPGSAGCCYRVADVSEGFGSVAV
jgi:REP element-mobilizing transposase RayT